MVPFISASFGISVLFRDYHNRRWPASHWIDLEVLRGELRKGDGTQSGDKMLMDYVLVTLRRPGGYVWPGVVFQPLLEELGYPQPGRLEVGAYVHLVLELRQSLLGVPLGASEGGPLLAALAGSWVPA